MTKCAGSLVPGLAWVMYYLRRIALALAAAAGRALRQQLAEATTAAQIEAVTWPEETTDADA